LARGSAPTDPHSSNCAFPLPTVKRYFHHSMQGTQVKSNHVRSSLQLPPAVLQLLYSTDMMWSTSVHDKDGARVTKNTPQVTRKANQPRKFHNTNQIGQAPASNLKKGMRPACASMPGLTKTVVFTSDKPEVWELNHVDGHEETMFKRFNNETIEPIRSGIDCIPAILQDHNEPLFELIHTESGDLKRRQAGCCLPTVLKDHHERMFQEMSVESSDAWVGKVSGVSAMVKDHHERLSRELSIHSSNSLVGQVGDISAIKDHSKPLFQMMSTGSDNSMKCQVGRDFHTSAMSSRYSSMVGHISVPAKRVQDEQPLFQEISCSGAGSTTRNIDKNFHMSLMMAFKSLESMQKEEPKRGPMDMWDMMSTRETLPTLEKFPTFDRFFTMDTIATMDRLPSVDKPQLAL